MKKALMYLLLCVGAVVIAGAMYLQYGAKNNSNADVGASDPKQATYIIDGTAVATEYFGNEVVHDFDGDGRDDIAFIATQKIGGGGTYFYAVIARNTVDGYIGSNGVFMGDRIAPQATTLSQNPAMPDAFIVSYADRKPGEDFSAQPSVGKSMLLRFNSETMQLEEVL